MTLSYCFYMVIWSIQRGLKNCEVFFCKVCINSEILKLDKQVWLLNTYIQYCWCLIWTIWNSVSVTLRSFISLLVLVQKNTWSFNWPQCCWRTWLAATEHQMKRIWKRNHSNYANFRELAWNGSFLKLPAINLLFYFYTFIP